MQRFIHSIGGMDVEFLSDWWYKHESATADRDLPHTRDQNTSYNPDSSHQ